VTLVERDGLPSETQSDSDAFNLFAERELIVELGTRQLREIVGVGETNGDKVFGGTTRQTGE
jgi:hypothetical protein